MADNKNNRRVDFMELPPEESNFIPEIVPDENTSEMIDVNTQKKYIKPYRQKEYKPLSDYEG